ncbi:hypothetical protein ABPG74_011995 [Tetrahymena malaccensis]
MKPLTIETCGERYAAVGVKILKPPQEEKIGNFIETFPTNLHSKAEQVSQEISTHGYRIIKFISKCKNGFVFSANKGRVRFSIKARLNRVVTEDGEISMAQKNRELPDNLKFYNNPYILSLIESFETNDYHYTVTEECRCNLPDFIKQVNIKYSSDSSYCFNRYAIQLQIALQQLQIGPEHPNSSRFVSHVRPEDVLISYNSDIRLNPNFGETQITLGIIPFCNSLYSLNQKNVSSTDRFSVSYAHLLLFMNGMSEKDILINWLKPLERQTYRSSSNSNGLDSFSQRIIENKQESYSEISDVYRLDTDNRGLAIVQKYKLDKIQEEFYTESVGETVFALSKDKCITIQQYAQFYDYCQTQISEERKEEIDDQIVDDMNRYAKRFRKIQFVQQMLENKRSRRSRSMPRELQRMGRKLLDLFKTFTQLKQKLVQIVEKKNQQVEKELAKEEEAQQRAEEKAEKQLSQHDSDPESLHSEEQLEKLSANSNASNKSYGSTNILRNFQMQKSRKVQK